MDSQQSQQEQIVAEEAFVGKAFKKLGQRRILTATVAADYAGGNPKLFLDTEDTGGTVPDEEFPCIIPFAHTNVKPSGVVVVIEVHPGEFAILGELGTQLPPGKLATNGHWTFITPGSIAVSSTAVTGRAQRLHNDQDLLVSKVCFEITAGGGGLVARVKLYSADGTLVIDTGDVDCSSNGAKSPDIDPPVRITPGTYIVEVTASVGVSWRCADLMANLAAIMNIGTTQRAVDHTMGSATTAVSFPILKFQS